MIKNGDCSIWTDGSGRGGRHDRCDHEEDEMFVELHG